MKTKKANYFEKFKHIILKDKLMFIILLTTYTFFIAFLEIVSLGSVLPFIAIVNDADVFRDSKYLVNFSHMFENLSTADLVYFLGGVVLFLFLMRAVVGIHYKYVITKFSYGVYYQIARKVYKSYLNMPYTEFTKKNTDDMRKAIINESNFFASLISSILLIISESLIFITILIIMFLADKTASVIIFMVTIIVYLLSKFFVSPNISIQGRLRADSQSDLFRLLGQSFGNFKLNKANNKYEILANKLSNILKIYTKSQVNYLTLSDLPRYIIETLGFSLIVILVLYLYKTNNGEVSEFIPILILFAVSLFRILPSYNRIITSLNNIHFFSHAFDIIAEELSVKQEILHNDKLAFENNIECNDLSFSHDKNIVLKNISFTINKGEKVAIVGESGSGKTTLVDIIMGLTSADTGSVCIDKIELTDKNKKYWRGEIGYIPQDIYLLDGTVKENILFDRSYSDEEVNKALKLASLSDVMDSKDGLETQVGDSGVQLSGGQKQRVGIARALLSNPELLVFDEGTSALDEKTEIEILNDLLNNNKEKTILFITHKKSLISFFDKVVSL